MKYLVDERVEKGYPDEPLLTATQSRGVIPKADYGSRTVEAQKDLHLLKLVEPGDYVISLRSFQGGIEYAHVRGIISPAYTVLQPKRDVRRGYYEHFFKSADFINSMTLFVTGIREGQNIDYVRLSRAYMPVPPPEEQDAIGRFIRQLDQRVNRLIKTKRRLIELLNEQKQAIIHQAVTRGLDPTVPLKPSGIEWLGDVPKHWEVVRFKNRVGFQEGPGIMAADFRDAGVPLLRISCVKTAEVTLHGCNFLDETMVARRWNHFKVRAGDYLLSASASSGEVSMVTEVAEGSIPYTGLIRLWARRDSTDMRFVAVYISSHPFQGQIGAAKSGVGIEHFGPTHLKRMWIALPPKLEQEAVVNWLDQELEPITSAVQKANAEIDLIREYRTRVVADVVTGQIDVRHLNIPDLDVSSVDGLIDNFDEELEEEVAEEESTDSA